MGIITGGNVIPATTQIPGSHARMTYVEAAPTDANVGGSAGIGGAARVPVNGELAQNVLNGNTYERTGANVWTRIDTL
jgi:hypothetical protein